MNRKHIAMLLFTTALFFQVHASKAQSIEAIIKAAVVRVIKAADLKIQREQNEVIWLQNAQKALENSMSQVKLEEIFEWVDKQRQLFSSYYDELMQVKLVISYYHKVVNIAQKQEKILKAYSHTWNVLNNRAYFSANELQYMSKVYQGILGDSSDNIDLILLVLQSQTTSMTDAERLKIINQATEKADKNYDDLIRFNHQNVILLTQRKAELIDIQSIKTLYGI